MSEALISGEVEGNRVNWPEVLDRLRNLTKEQESEKKEEENETQSELYTAEFTAYATLLCEHFQQYACSILEYSKKKQKQAAQEQEPSGEGIQRNDTKDSKDETENDSNKPSTNASVRVLSKELVIETRAALRIGLIFSSLKDCQLRQELQVEAIVASKWYRPISLILCCREGDSKCRILSSQLLSNLVTSNFQTAFELSNNLPISPTGSTIASRVRSVILGQIQEDEEEKDDSNDSKDDSKKTTVEGPNWADMILSCARSPSNRESFAGVVASLHNCLSSLNKTDDARVFAEKIACDGLLVSTLLRQMVSVESIKTQLQQQQQQQGNASSPNVEILDSATEWISLLIGKLCRLGMLPELFSSAAGGGAAKTNISSSSPPPPSSLPTQSKSNLKFITILPEHIVLLYCIRTETDNAFDECSSASRVDKNSACHPLGGELGDNSIVSMHLSLVEIFDRICSSLSEGKDEGVSILSHTTQQQDPDDESSMIQQSALLPILQILSRSLAIDTAYTSIIRTRLGKESSMFRFLILELGSIVFSLSAKMVGCKARDMTMTQEEQEIITVLVCMIGNMCYRCRQNQDMLRLTLIPTSTITSTSSPTLTTTTTPESASTPAEERNGLHALLSCTGLSPSCFTLREWAVVAIRNVLEGNELNQAEVAKLEAQQPLQTAELKDMGIRIDMDSKGKVSVAPVRDDKNSNNSDNNHTSNVD